MYSVAELVDRAKARGNIESDYRLAKVIGITHSAISNYRAQKSMPDARVLEQLCALSGDDVAVVMAQIQAQRERTTEGRNMWLMVAKRLAGGAQTAILSVLFTIVFVAASAMPERVEAKVIEKLDNLPSYTSCKADKLSGLLLVGDFLMVRLRRLRSWLWLAAAFRTP